MTTVTAQALQMLLWKSWEGTSEEELTVAALAIDKVGLQNKNALAIHDIAICETQWW